MARLSRAPVHELPARQMAANQVPG